MKHRCLIAIVVLTFLAMGMAQTRRATFFSPQVVAVAAPYSPTNNGVQNRSWWIADGQTAAADGTLTNWNDSGVTPITLTNLGATSTMPRWTNSVLNGHAFARFDGGDNNSSVVYTSSQPHEVVMVCRWWSSTITGARALFSGRTSTRHEVSLNAGLKLTSSLEVTIASTIKTNTWMVMDVLFSGTGSALFTNNISAGAVNLGTGGSSGFTIANYYNLAGASFLDVAEIITYTASLGAVDTAGTYSVATARSNLYVYLTNKYAIAP